jgi:hypothetical protein
LRSSSGSSSGSGSGSGSGSSSGSSSKYLPESLQGRHGGLRRLRSGEMSGGGGIGGLSGHHLQIASSKFVLCPSGLSMDSYRIWETLALGAIPVVESNPGLDRTYYSLPVLVVRNFSQVMDRYSLTGSNLQP